MIATTLRGKLDQRLQALTTDVADGLGGTGREEELLEAVGSWVGRLFADVYSRDNELACFKVDGNSGARVGAKDLLPELDDYLPLLAACGHRSYVLEQGEVVRRALADDRLVANPDPGLMPWLARSNPFYYTDLLLGMLQCHKLELGQWWLDAATAQVDTVLRRFLRNGLLVKEVHLGSGLKLPVSESNSLGLAEILVELGQLTEDQSYVRAAEQLVLPWLDIAEDEGAVPQVMILNPILALVPRFAGRRRTALLYKHNLMFLNALWSLASNDGSTFWTEAATRLTDRVCDHFANPAGLLHYRVVGGPHAPRHELPTLKCTLLAEHLCDLGVALERDDYLDRAASMVEPWLATRHWPTGLMAYDLHGQASDVDSLTDFSVTLLKLHAATGRPELNDAARDLLASMIAHHTGPYGLVRSVDVKTGQVLDDSVETRFVSLFLKPWLLLPHAADLYDRPGLLDLVRDR